MARNNGHEMEMSTQIPGCSFYKKLGNLTTAYFYTASNKRKRRKLDYAGSYFVLDRLIAERIQRNGEPEYLVLWQGYSRYDASYEPESNITDACIRYYNNPNPSTNDVREFADTLRVKVEQALKHNRRETLTFDCRADVFKSLFKGKGYFLNRWQVLQKDDFPQQYFPEGWAVRCTKHGEGMQLHFPVKVRWYIFWSPLKYTNDNDTGNIIPCKRAPLEKNFS